MSVKVLCDTCGKKAIIGKARRLSVDDVDLFCSCHDPECGLSFKAEFIFSHTLKLGGLATKLASNPLIHDISCLDPHRPYCRCGSVAIIRKTNRVSVSYADVYCVCSDKECGHQFVNKLLYLHTLSPSAKNCSALVSELTKAMSPSHKQALQQELALF
ncbi:ogr/Delta-like zinc finger family protein [Shewanella surugensis]|uniref:Ogr/Delta-like zinc finger family protein n=1 Tax=Shewanella surugensis TaxID=212020 RepID=A0ABT0L7Q7_9GAMM|nr:ogr/Delta-like zinc finger family protein [Shewanella surugensis]MCL1123540.1 ogr/Delta-like zinc finger family protein [Shewanella surugensis]